ncbi:MAG TPA: metallophosphoesterase family protein [Rubricoccaceae bacterium]
MTLGLVSDTHGFYHPELDTVFADVDLILHAGDVGPGGIVERLEKLAPVVGVYGNVDGPPVRGRFKEHVRIMAGGMRVWMTHIGGHPKRWDARVKEMMLAEPPDLFVCGHSHILRIERVKALGGMLYVNPGAAGMQGFHQVKTCVRLVVEGGKATAAEVVHLGEGAGAAAG